jgi:hypothetical protein
MTGLQPEDIAKRDQGLWTRKKAPIGFDDSIEYVRKVKTRFAKEPETYKAFLEILHTYQKEKKTIKEVKEQVSQLLEHHGDLTLGFNRFLPPGYLMARWRMVSNVIGPLMLAWRRAADRAYAPGGVGAERSSTSQWLILIAQVLASAVAGAALFIGFQLLWNNLTWVALALAIVVIVGLVAMVRVLRRSNDTVSIALAVIVHYEFLYHAMRLIPKMSMAPRFRIVFGVGMALMAHTVEVWIFAIAY